MGNDEIARREEPGPDEIRKGKATPDDQDTEGHKRFFRDGEPPLRADDDGKDGAPGPDEAKFSDRNVKVGIVPVEW